MNGKEGLFDVWTINWKDRTAVRSNWTYENSKDALKRANATREYHKTKVIHGHFRVFTVRNDTKFGEKLAKGFGMTVYQNTSRSIPEEEN